MTVGKNLFWRRLSVNNTIVRYNRQVIKNIESARQHLETILIFAHFHFIASQKLHSTVLNPAPHFSSIFISASSPVLLITNCWRPCGMGAAYIQTWFELPLVPSSLTAVAGMDTPHPRIDERFMTLLLLLLLLLLWCGRLVDCRYRCVAGVRRGRGGTLVRLGQWWTTARWWRQWRRQRNRGLLLDESGSGRRERHGSGRRRAVGQTGRCLVVSTYSVVERRRRLVLQSCGRRVPHRRARVAKRGVLENRSTTEPGCHVRRRSAGRIHLWIIVRVREVHDVISGSRVWRHGGGSEVLARDSVGRLTHAGVQ